MSGMSGVSDILTLAGVTVGYGDGTVLADINLSVAAGHALCLLGRNGVGKTTLVKTVMGLLRPRHGRVMFEGGDITRLAPNARARLGIGYVPQGRLVFPQLTVRDNLLVGQEALSKGGTSGLQDVLDLFPVLREMSNRLAGTLSGGQQQQLAIGRALIARPKLLLLDEPTEGIQPSVVLEIRRVLRRIRDQTALAMLVAEQFLDFATGLADEYCVLDGGVVALRSDATNLDRTAVRELLAV
jgi:urea transport system ATP-binding protein